LIVVRDKINTEYRKNIDETETDKLNEVCIVTKEDKRTNNNLQNTTQKSKDPTIISISEINLTKLTKYLNHSPKFN
jgi:hypothetical protein